MDTRRSSPTPPNSPVAELLLSNPNSPFSRDSFSSEDSSPQLFIGSTFTIDGTKIIFEIGGDRELVTKHARELKFFHFLNTNVTAEKIDKSHARFKSPKDWQQFKFEIDNNDTNNIAIMFWYLGKVTGDFRSPEELFENYSTFVSLDFVRTSNINKANLDRLATTLSQAAEIAIVRRNEMLAMHFSTLEDLIQANVDRQFWTVAELAAQAIHLQEEATNRTSTTLSDSSWAGFFYRAPAALQQIFRENATDSTDDEFEPETRFEDEPYYEFSGSGAFKLL